MMEINITFLGAARNVTGSKYLVEVNGIRLLVELWIIPGAWFKKFELGTVSYIT